MAGMVVMESDDVRASYGVPHMRERRSRKSRAASRQLQLSSTHGIGGLMAPDLAPALRARRRAALRL